MKLLSLCAKCHATPRTLCNAYCHGCNAMRLKIYRAKRRAQKPRRERLIKAFKDEQD